VRDRIAGAIWLRTQVRTIRVSGLFTEMATYLTGLECGLAAAMDWIQTRTVRDRGLVADTDTVSSRTGCGGRLDMDWTRSRPDHGHGQIADWTRTWTSQNSGQRSDVTRTVARLTRGLSWAIARPCSGHGWDIAGILPGQMPEIQRALR